MNRVVQYLGTEWVRPLEFEAVHSPSHVKYSASIQTLQVGDSPLFDGHATLVMAWRDFDRGLGRDGDGGKAQILVRVAEIDSFLALLHRVVDSARKDGVLPPAVSL
jgi:hypothetical protein